MSLHGAIKMSKQVLQTGDILKIPAEVAVCPICGSSLYVNFDHWVQEGSEWLAASCNMDCETEPDIDSDEWNEWFAGHYSSPYVDWLPVEHEVLAWINKNYCFEIEED
jgi:hypothetical protein